MREIELLRECRDLLEEVDRLISQIGSFEMDKTEFSVDEKEQLLVITINDSEGDVFTYKNAYEFLYEYMLNMHSDNIQYLREQYEDMFDDMDVNDWIMKRGYIEYINLRIRKDTNFFINNVLNLLQNFLLAQLSHNTNFLLILMLQGIDSYIYLLILYPYCIHL